MFCAPLTGGGHVPDALVKPHHYLLGGRQSAQELASHARAYGDWLAIRCLQEAADGRF